MLKMLLMHYHKKKTKFSRLNKEDQQELFLYQ
jgi:hypothetical protein